MTPTVQLKGSSNVLPLGPGAAPSPSDLDLFRLPHLLPLITATLPGLHRSHPVVSWA